MFNSPIKIKYRIKGVNPIGVNEWGTLPFSDKIELNKQFKAFQARSLTQYVSQKRQSNAKAMREFIDLYDVDEYFCMYYDDKDRRDDSFEVWYTKKPPI